MHSAAGLQRAQQVYLPGNQLPARWAGRARFMVLDTAFGAGHHFLATWQAWRDDPQRCETLIFVGIEEHPLPAAALAQAHAHSPWPDLAALLQAAWPVPASHVHRHVFEGGRVQWLLGLGAVGLLLPKLRLQADAVFLGGLTPDLAATHLLKAVAAHAASGATLACAQHGAALHPPLLTAGFVPRTVPLAGGAAAFTAAEFAPRHRPHRAPSAEVQGRQAVVVGAGLAGAAAAQALAQAGWQVTVLERHAAPASETSGNPAGLFHGTVNADDGPYARLFRAAALQARASHAAAIAQGVPGAAEGLLRLDSRAGGLPALQALLQGTGLPPGYVQVLSAAEASAAAGLPLPVPAWFYPGGGWVAPAAWVRWALAAPGVQLRTAAVVHRLQRAPSAAAATEAQGRAVRWQLLDANGGLLAEADAVVLANAAQAQTLLAPLGHSPWPLRHTRGQVTQFSAAHTLGLPVAGDGYAIPLPGAVLCGATREAGEPGDAALREEDHHHNLQRLQRLTGLQPAAADGMSEASEARGDRKGSNGCSGMHGLTGRTGWRLHTDDRLPICGALPALQLPPGQRLDQARLLPREAGLFVLTALGARGLTLAPLLAQLLAAQASGTPWPLEQDLADALDPGRWLVRSARHGGAKPSA